MASFLVGDDDFVIHFFLKERFESDIGKDAADLSVGNEVMFTLSAESKEEVDEWVEKVEEAGGKVPFDPKKSRNKFYEENGYYVCRFADPDGHLFNVFHNLNR